MTYVKTEWVNDSAPDIDAGNLNKMEQGIYDAHIAIATTTDLANTAKADAASAVATVNGHVGSTSNPHSTTAKQVGARHHKNAIKRGAIANGTFDNTTILQTLLDEIRDSGGGELYLPNDGNSIYRTRGLWVPGNCRVVSDGAKMFIYDGGQIRGHSGDGDLYSALGLRLMSQAFFDGSSYTHTGHVRLEGFDIDVATSGFQTHSALNPSDPAVVFYQANPWGGDLNRRPSNVYAANALAGLLPVSVGCNDVSLIDMKIGAGAYDGLSFSGDRIYVERVIVSGAKRNNITIYGGSEYEFFKCESNSCVAIIPLQRTVNSSWTFQEYAPGCGIECEPNGATNLETVRIRDCTFKFNGGAGVAFDLDEGGVSTCDGLVIDGCYFAGNGGPSRNDHTIKQGAFAFEGGSTSHAIYISNCALKSSAVGHGLEIAGASPKVIVSGCDLRFNSGGAVSGTYVDGGGNVTA